MTAGASAAKLLDILLFWVRVLKDLGDIELFAGLNSRQMARLQQVASLLKVGKGEMVFLPGDASDSVYVVAEGRVKVSNISETGKELTLAFHDTGELFGEMCLLDEPARRTMVIAVLPSRVWEIPKDEFINTALSSPAFALRLSAILGERRHDLENRMESLVFHDVPSRLAHQLIKLAEQYGMEKDGRIEIMFKLSQLELANLIGATRETTSTALNELKRAGILDTSHRTIVIRDLEALKELKGAI